MAGSLRSFRRTDAKAVVALSRRALQRPAEQVGNPVWSTLDELDAELADWEPAPEETLVVADDGAAVVAFGGVELPAGFDHAELFGPIVDAEHQGERIGTSLLERSLEIATAHDASRVVAAVGTRNARARLLLESAGFRRRRTPQATYRLRPESHRPFADAPAGVHVRRATLDDVGDALAIYRESFPEGRFPEAVWRSSVENGTVYVAEVAGRPAAVLDIDPADRWIYHLGVTPGERGRGVAAYLLSESLRDYWRAHPGESLGLDVDADNVPALRLYRRQGFAPWLVLQAYELTLG